MPRAKSGVAHHHRKKRVQRLAKGFSHPLNARRAATMDAVRRAGAFSYRDRRVRKRDMRGLWIVRLSAACRMHDIRYSQFINALAKAKITLNRKMLSEMAVADPAAFDAVTAKVKAAL